jgi:malonyl CoA-acyl carrier protein transacylase/thioesterase domain-containing protein/acyl carrier protein
MERIWAEILQHEAVDSDDDFFELGGNSLLAVNLFARIEREFGVKLPFSALLEAPTLGQLSHLLATGGMLSPSVVLRDGLNACPLFLVHDADGETLLYRRLAQSLNSGRAVYGLLAQSEPEFPNVDTRLEQMAAFQIRTIRTIQPHGPYLLGGLCAGGHISFELARQLESAGEEVALVALLDAADVAAKEKPLRFARQSLNRFVAGLEGASHGGRPAPKPPAWPKRALKVARTALKKGANFSRYLLESRVRVMRDEARVSLFRFYRNRGWQPPRFLRGISVRTTCESARRHYRPKAPFVGQLVLFRATCGVGNDEPYRDRYSDRLLGWRHRSTREIHVVDVPGGHSSMLQEPNVGVLAGHLQNAIDEALKRAALKAKPEPLPRETALWSPPRSFHLLTVQSPSRDGLQENSTRVAERLDACADQDLADFASSLALTRSEASWRRVAAGGSREELIERLEKGSGKGVWTSSEPVAPRKVAFLLAGVGEQVAGTGKALYDAEPAFRRAIDDCAAVLNLLLREDIRAVMFAETAQAGSWLRGKTGVLTETRIAQPAAFALDWALAQMWLSWGVKPSAVLGYSVGEFVAAALSGVLRLEDALTFVARRAEWITERAEPGVMLAVPLGECELLPRIGKDVWIAAVNSPQATVVGGREEAIVRLERELEQAEVVSRRVESAQGSHTPLLAPVAEELSRLVSGLHREPPQIPMLSNVTGTWLSSEDAHAADYWSRHMCQAVRFESGVGELLSRSDLVLLELGAGAGLGAMVRQHARFTRDRHARVLSSLPSAWDRASEPDHVAGVLGRLWVEGAWQDWERYYASLIPDQSLS